MGPFDDDDDQAMLACATSPVLVSVLPVTRRKRIPTETVSVPNATVPAMDEQFRTLILRDGSRRIDRLRLGLMLACVAAIAFSADTPSVVSRNHMLVAGHHSSPFRRAVVQIEGVSTPNMLRALQPMRTAKVR